MAVWPPSTDQLALILLIVAGTLDLSPVSTAPVETSSDPWWSSPCDNGIPPITRHSRSAKANTLDMTLKNFQSVLKNTMKQVENLYHLKKDNVPKGKFRWLKLKRYIKNIKNDKKTGLTEFYTALQHFAGTLEKLRDVKVHTKNKFNEQERERIFLNFTQMMKILLCEVHDLLVNDGVLKPKTISRKEMKIGPLLTKTNDLSQVLILDVNFFRKVSQFFNQTQRLVKNKYKRMKKSQPSSSTVVQSNNKIRKSKKGPKKSAVRNQKRT